MRNTVDKLALNIVSMVFLMQGVLFGYLAEIVKDPDLADRLSTVSMSGFMIFDNPDMLPPEQLELIIWVGRFWLIGFPIMFIFNNIIKPLLMR